jgi:protein-disulfide isomerase
MPIDRKCVWITPLALASLIAFGSLVAAESPKPAGISLNTALLHDPASPVAGNPDGDVTVVAFTDYNCPYCRKSDGDLAALIASDAKVRVVYKD